MAKKKRVPKHTIVTPEIAEWRKNLKVGDQVKIDKLLNKEEPIGEILEDCGIVSAGARVFVAAYERPDRGPGRGFVSEYVLWPIEGEKDEPETTRAA